MAVAWLVWPIILIIAILGKAFLLSLRHLKFPILAGLVAVPGMYVVILIAGYVDPARPPNMSNNFQAYQFLVMWWNRWRKLGVARLIPNGWQMNVPHYPNNKELLWALFHVCAAAGITVACLIFALVFIVSILNTLSTVGKPYQGGVR